MPHHRHARPDDLADDGLVAVHAFELHRVRSARHERSNGRHRGADPFSKRQERQIRDHEFAACRAGDRARMQAHEPHGRRKRRRVTVHDHRRRVSDEDRVHVRLRDDAGGPGVVRRDDRDLPALGFESREVLDGVHRPSPGRDDARIGGTRPRRLAGRSPARSIGMGRIAGTCRMDQVLITQKARHDGRCSRNQRLGRL
jgi:hypothetical protein